MKIQNGAYASMAPLGLEKVELAFRDAMQATFGLLDWIPLADSTIQRFHVPGDRVGTRNGWYCLFADASPAGAFGSWKTGDLHHWRLEGATTPTDAEHIRRRIDEARRQREAEQQQRRLKAAEYAHRLWRDARRADPHHPYLAAKGVRPHGLRQHRNRLLVPLYHDGQLVNLQSIAPDGSKLFQSGGRVKGCYSPLGALQGGQPLYICEGWATGATLHQHSGNAVACAMNAGNLKPVALALRVKYPDAQIIIAGDDDRQTEGNPGRTAATAAALAVDGLVTFPGWPDGAPLRLTDFNDLANWSAAHERD